MMQIMKKSRAFLLAAVLILQLILLPTRISRQNGPSGFFRTARLIFSGINVVCEKNSANNDRIKVNSSIGVI